MDGLSGIIALVLAVVLWVLYHQIFHVVYFGNGFMAMLWEFIVCMMIAAVAVEFVGKLILGAISGIGGLLLGLLKIALILFVIFVVLGVIGAVLKKCGILKDEPKEGTEPGGEETTLTPDQDQDKAQDQDTTE